MTSRGRQVRVDFVGNTEKLERDLRRAERELQRTKQFLEAHGITTETTSEAQTTLATTMDEVTQASDAQSRSMGMSAMQMQRAGDVTKILISDNRSLTNTLIALVGRANQLASGWGMVATAATIAVTAAAALAIHIFRNREEAERLAASIARVNAEVAMLGATELQAAQGIVGPMLPAVRELEAAYVAAKEARDALALPARESNVFSAEGLVAARDHERAVLAAADAQAAYEEQLKPVKAEVESLTKHLVEQKVPFADLNRWVESLSGELREAATKHIPHYDIQLKVLRLSLDAVRMAAVDLENAQKDLSSSALAAAIGQAVLNAELQGGEMAMVATLHAMENELGVLRRVMEQEDRLKEIVGALTARKKEHKTATEASAVATRQLGDEAEDTADDLDKLAQQAERAQQAFERAALRDIDILGRGLVTALQREQQEVLDGALDAISGPGGQRDAYMDMHNERLRLIERDRDAALDAIDDQIAALTQASRDDRLADLERSLLLAWDPRERARIEQQITEHMRQEEATRLRNERTALEDGYREREDAARRELDAQMAEYDRQEREARDTYERMTDAWTLESKARELIMAGEMERVTGLIETHLDEWPGLWQSMSDAVINGPLDNLAAAVRGVFAGIGALGGPAAAAAAGDPVIAAMQAQGHQMVAAGTNKAILDMHRQALRDRGGFPTFDAGGVVPGPRGAPTLALVHGGETVLPTHREPMPAPVVNIHFASGMEWLRNFVRVEIELEQQHASSFGALAAGVKLR